MQKIRVLIVDDSAVTRRLLRDALSDDPAIEIAGTAANGRIALARLAEINPDLVTLDVEMPDLDGLATLAELRKTRPRLPVVMFSAHTQRGAAATLDALARGASDYVTKPARVGNFTEAIGQVRSELIPKIKALCSPRRCVSGPLPGVRPSGSPGCGVVKVIAVGVSTGGPVALSEILQKLPADLPVPMVIVQHMPPLFTKYLAERLDAVSALEVREAVTGETVRPGAAWIAPGSFHMVVVRSAAGETIRLHQGPPENSCRPAADVLFRSVAEVYGAGALAVVLTGMGQDGLRGCRAIREAGGRIIVQDEATSVVWGMPGTVATAGLADQVLPLDRIAGELTRLTVRRRPPSRLTPIASTEP